MGEKGKRPAHRVFAIERYECRTVPDSTRGGRQGSPWHGSRSKSEVTPTDEKPRMARRRRMRPVRSRLDQRRV